MKATLNLFPARLFWAVAVGMSTSLSSAATFSNANWISMGGIPGTDNTVYVAAADALGNLYVAGSFTLAGNVVVNHIAKWDGSSWSALGSGITSVSGSASINALAVSGGNLYVGGSFNL